jgi:hypothetical protein
MGGGTSSIHRVDSTSASQGLVPKQKQNRSWEVKNKTVAGRRWVPLPRVLGWVSPKNRKPVLDKAAVVIDGMTPAAALKEGQ